jgi:uncharacterized membrane protein YcaP (DUF421 family)
VGTIIKSMLFYMVLLILLRIIPRRTGNVMTPFEYILLFLFGGISIQAVVADDRSVINALLGISTIALMHILVSTLKQHFDVMGKLFDGTPVVIVEHGKWLDDRMRSVQLHAQDVMAAARNSGISLASKINMAVVERNGSVSVLTRDQIEESADNKEENRSK